MSEQPEGEIFDPEIHATDRDGRPSRTASGGFRKKRKDAGRARSTSTRRTSTRTRTAAKAQLSDRDRYAKAWNETLSLAPMMLAFVDPVDAYCAAEIKPILADAIADVAAEQPWLAAVSEKIAVGGAVGALAAVVLMGAVQFGHNHGAVPEQYARMFGAKPRHEIEALLQQRGEQLAAKAGPGQQQDGE